MTQIVEKCEQENQNEILKLVKILSFVISEDEAKSIASKLLSYFETIFNICNSKVEEILKIDGISDRVANFLITLPLLINSYELLKEKEQRNCIDSTKKLKKYLGNALVSLQNEEMVILSLDNQNKIIETAVFQGIKDEVSLPVNQAIQFAFKTKASKIILAHNHPSGNSEPSLPDIIQTKNILVALRSLKIMLVEHIIIAKNSFFSFKENVIIDIINAIKFRDNNEYLKFLNNDNRLKIAIQSSKLKDEKMTSEEKYTVSACNLAINEIKNKEVENENHTMGKDNEE